MLLHFSTCTNYGGLIWIRFRLDCDKNQITGLGPRGYKGSEMDPEVRILVKLVNLIVNILFSYDNVNIHEYIDFVSTILIIKC